MGHRFTVTLDDESYQRLEHLSVKVEDISLATVARKYLKREINRMWENILAPEKGE